ncbi:hypothetical protein EXIGLDRAFT_746596 [Exidia glandulosa HHB12029]|uniref:Uncharacterized protein n=1 Tax=Exidia glandulosa HHB12029 TaxID=1314781 RepID=A0A165LY50_EXIGL|nr:hypothetical protein EXIGLDRAFT_746596 [Exidia glandulosa HHB12029]
MTTTPRLTYSASHTVFSPRSRQDEDEELLLLASGHAAVRSRNVTAPLPGYERQSPESPRRRVRTVSRPEHLQHHHRHQQARLPSSSPGRMSVASRSEADLSSFQIKLEDLPPLPAPHSMTLPTSRSRTSSTKSTSSSNAPSRLFTRAWKRVAGTLRKPVDESYVPDGFIVVSSPSRPNL